MQMFSVSILCRQSIRLFQVKLWYQLIGMHMHYLCINIIREELQRAITLTELAPYIINVYLEDIMCLQGLMKFHHCLFKILRKNQNIMDRWMDNVKTVYTPHKHSLQGYNNSNRKNTSKLFHKTSKFKIYSVNQDYCILTHFYGQLFQTFLKTYSCQ